MLLIAAPVAASLIMLAALVVERRLGPAAGGWTAALPFSLAVALFAVSRDQGVDAAREVALSAAGHVGAQVTFGLVFGAALARRGLGPAVVAGVVGYVGVSGLVATVPWMVAVAASGAALGAVALLLPPPTPRPAGRRRASATVAVCVAAAAIVAGTAMATRVFGSEVGGAVGAFPSMCFALALAVTASGGREDGVRVAFGLTRSLPCYLSFAGAFGLSAPHLGIGAFGVASAVAICTAGATWWGMRPRQEASTPGRDRPTRADLSTTGTV